MAAIASKMWCGFVAPMIGAVTNGFVRCHASAICAAGTPRSAASDCRRFFDDIAVGRFRFTWRKKYGGMEVPEVKRLKSLEEENARLRKLLAEAMLDKEALQVAPGRKY